MAAFGVNKTGDTVAISFAMLYYLGSNPLFQGQAYVGVVINKNGQVDKMKAQGQVRDAGTYGSVAPFDVGPQFGEKKSVLWQFDKEYPDLTGFKVYKRRWGVATLTGKAIQSKELHDYAIIGHTSPHYDSTAKATKSGIDKNGRFAYVNQDYKWPLSIAGTYAVIDDAGTVLASSEVP